MLQIGFCGKWGVVAVWAFLIKFIIAFFSVLCTMATLTQFFFGITSFSELSSKFCIPEDFYEAHKNTIYIVALAAAAVIIFTVQLVAYLRKSKRLSDTGEILHDFYDDMRDQTFKMNTRNRSNRFANDEEFYLAVHSVAQSLCEKVQKFVVLKSGKDFGVCIKLLINDQESGQKTTYTYSLCRSTGKKDKRRERIRQTEEYPRKERFERVEDNTSFSSILFGKPKGSNASVFACSNLFMLVVLNKILHKPAYKNPNKEYWKHYLSTIVVPIRIDKKHLQSKESGYRTVGFLCLDYRWPISRSLKNELTGYAKGFADSFFALFNEVAKRDRMIL